MPRARARIDSAKVAGKVRECAVRSDQNQKIRAFRALHSAPAQTFAHDDVHVGGLLMRV